LTAEIIIAADDASPGLPEILFRSDHIEVRRIAAGDGRHQVVTFESYHDDPGFGRSGFGESFFARAGLTGIHVLTSGNDWYQYPEMDAVLAVIRDAVTGADRVLTYGSSMGGYAAVRFADALGATHVLSLSPQYSIDPRKFSADRRWWWDQKRVTFLPAYNGPITCRANVVVAFDPTLKLDTFHADLIARDVAVRVLNLPYAGHPVTTVLIELGLLQRIALALASGSIDLSAIESEFHARREEASMWLAEYSSRLPEGGKLRARDLSARAAAMAPGNATIQHQYAMRLHDLGQYDEAIIAHEAAVALSPHPIFVLSLSRSLFFTGRLDEAVVRAEQALAERRFDSEYFRWAARARLATGDRAGAYDHARSAFRLVRTLRNFCSLLRYRLGASHGR
jgi:pimeloyl-ACP methyl ester carboxylesterase